MTPPTEESLKKADFLKWFETKLDKHLRNWEGDDSFACIGCDMGAAGWSSKGEGYHDDIEPYVCFLIEVKKALDQAKLEGMTSESVKGLWRGLLRYQGLCHHAHEGFCEDCASIQNYDLEVKKLRGKE